jgi:hypothetical protein
MQPFKQTSPRSMQRLNPKKDTPDMRTDSNPVQAPSRLKVENGVVIGRWRYHDDVKFTDSEIAQLDGPLPKIIYIEVTGGRAASTAFLALSAATATAALKAVAERADQLSTVYMPADAKRDLAEFKQFAMISEGDDDDEPHHFTVRVVVDDPEAESEYVIHQPRVLAPFAKVWPRCGAKGPLSAIAVSIDDRVATVTLEPGTAEFSEETKAAIVAADMQRVFIDARGLKPADYPEDSLAFLFREATLVCAMGLDCSKPGAEDDIEATHAIFDARAEGSLWVVRLFTDCPGEWGDFVQQHRPVGRHCLAWPTYDPEPAAG